MINKTILLVDDERDILRAFNRLFMDSEYNLLLANSGKEALEIINEERIDILISDMKMPSMDGYELLSIVKRKYPNTLRIILSGFSEKKTMIRCIQENLALTYLLKPWDNNQILLTIGNLLRIQHVLKENHLEELTNASKDDFTIENKVYDELLIQIEQKEQLHIIAHTIEKDFVLSAIILRFVNSVFHGHDIASVEKALEYLNLQEIKNIILSKKLTQTINGDEKTNNLKGLLWKHAGLSNIITHFFYKEMIGKGIPENYRLAALLHNIGMLVLLKIYGGNYEELVYEALRENIPFADLEKERYGIDHQEAGGYLLSWWGIPYPIVETAIHHHNPLKHRVIHRELINIAHIAGHYAWKLIGFIPPQICEDAIYNDIGTTKDLCDQIIFKNFYTEKYT